MDAIPQVPSTGRRACPGVRPRESGACRGHRRAGRDQGVDPELPLTIGGEQRIAGGDRIDVVQPHRRRAVLGTTANATAADARAALDAARAAALG